MLLFAALGLAMAGTPESAIRTTLDDFVQGAASRDSARVSKALDPGAIQYVVTPDARMTLDTPTYLGLLEAGKIGGTETALQVHDLSVTGSVATATMTRQAGPVRFDDAVSLQKVDGDWKIVAIAVQMTPPS